jgi:hypothetical protein
MESYMNTTKTLILFAAVVATTGCVSNGLADAIPTLFNTGVDASGALLPDAVADPHYTLASSPYTGGIAYTLNPGYPVGTWMLEGPASRWLAPVLGDSANALPGTYVYQTAFDLTGYDPASASIDGAWTMDDGGTAIRLNGAATTVGSASGFADFKFFTIASGFIEGLNTLEFVVSNGGGSANPSGLRVEFASSASPIAANTPLTLLSQPTNRTVRATSKVSLLVVAHGSAPVSYQWYRNKQPIADGTNAVLVFNSVAAGDAGDYTVAIANKVNAITNTPVKLTVLPAMEFHAARYAGVQVSGIPGNKYQLEASANIESTPWTTVSNLNLLASPTLIIDRQSTGTSRQFYRAKQSK